ncbi:MAG: hypothetical protein AAFN91_12395 [Pseudomonadota bacterium]
MKRKIFKKCILHIGAEKTGTTTIQHYLRENRSILARRGIVYPRALDAVHYSQWEFVAAAHHAPWQQDMGVQQGIVDAQSQSDFRNKLAESLDKEFRKQQNAEILVISSEHFHSRLERSDEIEFVKGYLSAWAASFQIVVYFRRQDELAISFLSTRLKSASGYDLDNLLGTLNGPARYYEHDKIYESWANVFGAQAVTPLVFDPEFWPNGDLIADFCRATSIPKLKHSHERRNPSLNRKGFQFIHALNGLYPLPQGGEADKNRRALVELVGELFPGRYFPISRNQALSFYRQFEPNNARLRELAFPSLKGTMFSDDFSAYPEQAEPLAPSYAEAVEVAIALWETTSGAARRKQPLLSRLLRQR